MKKNIKEPKISFREASFSVRADADGNESVEMTVSSESPVISYIDFNGSYQRVYEILDHTPTSIDMSRCADGLVILDSHHGDQIGLMAVNINDRKMGGVVEFCSGTRAQEIKMDAVRKLRRNTSVGYRVDPSSYRLEGEKDGIPVVRAMSWMPYEASFVPVPADTSVGVYRAESEMNPAQTRHEKTGDKKMDPKEMAKLFSRAAKYGIDADAVQALIDDGKGRAELDALIVEKQDAEKAALLTRVEVAEKSKPAQRAV